MCGIWNAGVDELSARAMVERMCEKIEHRGPNEIGLCIATSVILHLVIVQFGTFWDREHVFWWFVIAIMYSTDLSNVDRSYQTPRTESSIRTESSMSTNNLPPSKTKCTGTDFERHPE